MSPFGRGKFNIFKECFIPNKVHLCMCTQLVGSGNFFVCSVNTPKYVGSASFLARCPYAHWFGKYGVAKKPSERVDSDHQLFKKLPFSMLHTRSISATRNRTIEQDT